MKYESTILKRLIDTYGVVGNPRYISEIIKEFIVQGKERFPELFTYQADWLAHIDEFGLNPTYTVSYTGQSIYAPNTLERPVKSAILKGSTKYRDIDTGEVLDAFEDGRNLELVSVRMPVLKTVSGFNLLNPNAEPIAYQGNDVLHPDYFKAKFGDSFSVTKNTSGELWCSLFCYDSDKNLIKAYYQNNHLVPRTITLNDDSLRDVAYVRFECAKWTPFKDIMLNYGEQMPFAEYSGEYKTNILSCLEPVELGSVGEVKDELNLLTQQLTQRTETRAYQEGDELNSEFVTDMTNTRYKLAQEVVKTVDLTILDQNGQNVKHLMSFNGGTHFTTSSQDGSLLPMLTVDVVTDLEEILMVCSSEGNTM